MTLLFLGLFPTSSLFAKNYDDLAKQVRTDLEEWVKADTFNPPGNESRITKLVGERLKEVEIPFEIVEFAPGRSNLVARLKGTGPDKPLLILAHIDVVGSEGQKWSTDPHKVVEKDGFLYGRGVMDDLGMAAISLELFIALKGENTSLKRDVILALTGDEESGGAGIRYLLEKRPELVDASVALNEGGGIELGADGKVKYVALSSAEKTYQDFRVLAKGTPGHSSVPRPDNAIFRLGQALDKLGKYVRPARLLPVTREYFRLRAQQESPKLAAAMKALVAAKGPKLPAGALAEIEKDPSLAATLRTTCVATTISGGTRANVLPAEAQANINCRILPDESIESVRQSLLKVVKDPHIEIQATSDFGQGGYSPVTGEIPTAVQKLSAQSFPGAPVIPIMVKGTTDSRFLRRKGIAAYGFSPIAMMEADFHRIHGADERVALSSIRNGVELFDRLLADLSVKK